MYPVPQKHPKIRLSDENGVVIISDHQSEALKQLYAHYPLYADQLHPWRHRVNFEMQEYDPRSKTCMGLRHEYVLRVERTACGQITTSITARGSKPHRRRARRHSYAEHHFRKRPVPRTGRGRCCVSFRDPKTYAELRALNGFLHDDERHEYKIKSRMRRRYLPTSYYDIFVPYTRSWKKYRKTQWKPKG